WVSTILSGIVALFDDPIVPFQFPAMLVVVEADTPLGATELPLHAARPTIAHTTSARRIVPLGSGSSTTVRQTRRRFAIAPRDAHARVRCKLRRDRSRHACPRTGVQEPAAPTAARRRSCAGTHGSLTAGGGACLCGHGTGASQFRAQTTPTPSRSNELRVPDSGTIGAR